MQIFEPNLNILISFKSEINLHVKCLESNSHGVEYYVYHILELQFH